jgi:hypothetical protein
VRYLLLLVAMVAAGQTTKEPTMAELNELLEHLQESVRIERRLQDAEASMNVLLLNVMRPTEYRIDWLRPDLYLWPNTVTVLGSAAYAFGHEGFAHIYIQAPLRSVVILLPNGKSVTITREEIDARAK